MGRICSAALGGIIMLNMSSPDPDAAFAILGGSVIGALLPDLDHAEPAQDFSQQCWDIYHSRTCQFTDQASRILHTPIFGGTGDPRRIDLQCSTGTPSGELRRKPLSE